MSDSPRLTMSEIYEIEDDARAALLNMDMALVDSDRWLGQLIEVCRSHRRLLEVSLHGK